ncbi:MAG: hypothetical protein AAGH64_05260 [Planctomycetota bacterium]
MTNESTPSETGLPDDLLLDLVEGTLRASDVERVRAALKGDPELAVRLEAMRADRMKVVSLGDPGVSPAPAGLVTDALGVAERDQILTPPGDPRAASSVRRLTPALVAACVGVVAVAGWYFSTQTAPTAPANNTLAQGGDPDKQSDTMGPQLPNEEEIRSSFSLSAPERDEDILDLLQQPGGQLPGSLRMLADAPSEEPDEPGVIESPGAVGAPFDPFAALGRTGVGADEQVDVGGGAADALPDPFRFAAAPAEAPEIRIPAEAAAWAREGVLRVVLAPEAGEGRSGGLSTALRRRLAIAYDPSLSSGWGVTSLPALRVRTTAMRTADEAVASVGTSTETTSVSVRVEDGASDEALLSSLGEMARTLSSLTGVGVTLERSPDDERVDTGGVALGVDTLLWWTRPPEKWAPMRIYELPVVTPE